jgi:ribosomal protein S18 acetylase RimI-like enzyme
VIAVTVRQADARDLEQLLALDDDEERRRAEHARFDAQERGEGLLLVAWEGDAIRGRVRFRFFSKYVEVIDEFGEFPEINALDAWPQGEGVGTQIIAECERIAAARGEAQVGIAVVVTNVNARRLYERLGYEYWGDVIDDGQPAAYLLKKLP